MFKKLLHVHDHFQSKNSCNQLQKFCDNSMKHKLLTWQTNIKWNRYKLCLTEVSKDFRRLLLLRKLEFPYYQ